MDTIIDMMYVIDQSKQCAQIYLPKKILCCLNLQLPIVSFKSVETVHKNLFAKMASCINLQQQIVFYIKSSISDMRDRKTNMYIEF